MNPSQSGETGHEDDDVVSATQTDDVEKDDAVYIDGVEVTKLKGILSDDEEYDEPVKKSRVEEEDEVTAKPATEPGITSRRIAHSRESTNADNPETRTKKPQSLQDQLFARNANPTTTADSIDAKLTPMPLTDACRSRPINFVLTYASRSRMISKIFQELKNVAAPDDPRATDDGLADDARLLEQRIFKIAVTEQHYRHVVSENIVKIRSRVRRPRQLSSPPRPPFLVAYRAACASSGKTPPRRHNLGNGHAPVFYLMQESKRIVQSNFYKQCSKVVLNKAALKKYGYPAVEQLSDAIERFRLPLGGRKRTRGELSFNFNLNVYEVIEDQYDRMVSTYEIQKDNPSDKYKKLAGAYVLTTESEQTANAIEITRLTLVDPSSNLLVDSFVRTSDLEFDKAKGYSSGSFTSGPIYRSRLLRNLCEFIGPKTILIGHKMNQDLTRLRLSHEFVVDLAIVWKTINRSEAGEECDCSLKAIAKCLLDEEYEGTSSLENAKLIIKLMHALFRKHTFGSKSKEQQEQ